MEIGYKLAAEAFGPDELVRQAVRAEESGFDLVEISDHYHPWLDNQGHSPFAWTVLGAIAARTERIQLATGVTCPTVRYHPAIVAQAAATLSLLSGNRFTLGLGSGERLNEHVVGLGFPSARQRHAMLREAIEIIRLLWKGGYQSYDGVYLDLEDARIFDLPDPLPRIAIAAGGPDAATLAAEYGDALFTTEPRLDLVEAYRSAGGTGPRYGEVGIAFGTDATRAAEHAWTTTRWSLAGWKVLAELPNPVNFKAASEHITIDDVKAAMPCGNDLAPILAKIQSYLDAGIDRIVVMNAGPDVDGFFDFMTNELGDAIRRLRTTAQAE